MKSYSNKFIKYNREISDVLEDGPVYVSGPWTVKYFDTKFEKSERNFGKTDVTISVVYGTQEEAPDQIESAYRIIYSNIYEPLVSLMQSTPSIFGGWEELNSEKSLADSISNEIIDSEVSPYSPKNEGQTSNVLIFKNSPRSESESNNSKILKS